MVEIQNRKNLDKWLDGREPEDFIILAARAALRILPMNAGFRPTSLNATLQGSIFEVFHASAAAWTAALGGAPDYYHAAEIAGASAANAATEIVHETTDVMYVAADAAHAVHSSSTIKQFKAALADNETSADIKLYAGEAEDWMSDLSDAAESAIIRSADVAPNSADAIWKAISADATALEDGTTAADLAAAPLWPMDAPHWVTEDWAIIVNALSNAPDEDWGVWIDWYEARLRGDPTNEALERARVLDITEEMWKQGPKVVNAEIRRLIEKRTPPKVSDLPAEHAVAPRFAVAQEKIGVQSDRPDESATDDQRAFHDALKNDIAALLDICSPTSNRYGNLRQAGSDFATALGIDYSQTNRTLLWLAGRKLRTMARADEDRRTANDPEDEPLDAGPGAALDQVVTVYNVFATLDSILRQRDRASEDRPGVVTSSNAEIKAVRDAVNADAEVFTEDVVEVLDGMIEEAASPIEDVAARGDALVQMTFENLIISTAGTVLKEEAKLAEKKPSEFIKSAKVTAGAVLTGGGLTGVAYGAGAFIATNKASLIAMASTWPAGSTFVTIINHIAKLFA